MSEPKGVIPEKQIRDEVQFVRKSTKLDIITLELIVLPSALLGGAFFALLVLLNFRTMNLFSLLLLWLFFPILLAIMALCRNYILEWVFRKISHESYLQFAIFWQIMFPILVIAISFLLWFIAPRDPIYLLSLLTFLFVSMALYFIFERPLSHDGMVQVLFEGLFSSLDNFPRRQYYLKKISKIIENLLKMGNIQVSSGDLIYHINKKLLETDEDVSNDLENVRAWMLGRQRTCLDSLKKIIPDIRIEPPMKDSFFRRVLENPTPIQADLIKFFVILIVLLTVLLVHPELISQAINLAKGLLGL